MNTDLKSRFSISTLFFVSGFLFASWASRIPTIQSELNLNNVELGSILLCLPIGAFLALPLAGFLVSRYTSKTISVFSALAMTASLISIGLVKNVFGLAIILFSYGMFSNSLNIAMNTQAVTLEKKYGRYILSSFHGFYSIANMFGAIAGGFMISVNFNPLVHFTCISVLCISMITFSSRFLINQDLNLAGDKPIFILPDKTLLSIGLIAFCVTFAEGSIADWSGIYFEKDLKAEGNMITSGYGAFSLAMAIVRFSGDLITNRIGPVKMLTYSGLLMALGLSGALIFSDQIISLIGFLLVGAGCAVIIPVVYSAAGRIKSMKTGMALAAVSTMGFLGNLTGPALIGFLSQLFTLEYALFTVVLLSLCIVFLSPRLSRI